MRTSLILATAALGTMLLAAHAVRAENVDLSTVPSRNTVQLTIYNSEDLTLVRETRKVSFKPGANTLQFSWANTLIDPTSVELRFLTHGEKLTVLDTTFPHAKPQMLYWNVQSEMDGEATIEITYFTSGISWSADYICISDPDESQLHLEGFVRVNNNSGEEYEDAQVRLVVGRINLVQRIAELAHLPAAQIDSLIVAERNRLQNGVVRAALARANEFSADGRVLTSNASVAAPKEVAKEGLGEYFIYAIEGTETIRNAWSKRMRSLEAAKVPFRIQYRYRTAEYGDQLVRMYLLTNDKESKLGTTPLPDGTVRLFRQNGRDGLSFLVAQAVKYVPISDKIELNLGVDPEVIFDLVKLRSWRDDLWMQVNGADIYRRVDQPGVQIEINSAVAGWDDHTLFAQRLRNYTKKPIDLEIRRTFGGHVVFRSELAAKNHDFQTVQYTAAVKPGEKAERLYEIVQRQGHNATQNNVTIQHAAVKP
ncbi:MAG: hypothetical protein ACLP9L_02360 [Thermoguttaceae bacterium]